MEDYEIIDINKVPIKQVSWITAMLRDLPFGKAVHLMFPCRSEFSSTRDKIIASAYKMGKMSTPRYKIHYKSVVEPLNREQEKRFQCCECPGEFLMGHHLYVWKEQLD